MTHWFSYKWNVEIINSLLSSMWFCFYSLAWSEMTGTQVTGSFKSNTQTNVGKCHFSDCYSQLKYKETTFYHGLGWKRVNLHFSQLPSPYLGPNCSGSGFKLNMDESKTGTVSIVQLICAYQHLKDVYFSKTSEMDQTQMERSFYVWMWCIWEEELTNMYQRKT